jgi:hypothetical protein
MEQSNAELQLSKLAVRTGWVLLLVAPLVTSYLVGRFTDFGKNVDPLFFEVMAAGLLPILLVAVIVQYSLLLSQVNASNLSTADRKILEYEHTGLTRLYGATFAVGEGTALFAVAADTQSTFLLLTTAMIAAILLIMLIFEVEQLIEPERMLPENFRKRTEVRLTAKAERHEAIAASLRSAAAREHDQQG